MSRRFFLHNLSNDAPINLAISMAAYKEVAVMLSEIVFTYLTNGSLLSKKSLYLTTGYSGHWYELSNQLNTVLFPMRLSAPCR